MEGVKTMYVINRKRFRYAVRTVRNAVLVLIAVIWFCVFIYQHSGLNVDIEEVSSKAYREDVAYEWVVRNSPENGRVKESVPIKVVYRFYE